MKHFLETLGLDEHANWHDIRDGYRDQMKIWHPDRFAGDERLLHKAEEQTKKIHYAIRRLKELRADLEDSEESFDEDAPFIEQYAQLTAGYGRHGYATREDRSEGYNQESFANWEAIRKTVISTVSESAARLSAVVRDKGQRRRSVVIKTTRVKRCSNALTFALCSGILVVVACIGALNLPKLMRNPNVAAAPENQLSREAEREITQIMLNEPVPIGEEKNMEQKIKQISKRKTETRPALITAAMNCDEKLAAKLLRQGKNINHVDTGGQTALIWAAKRNCPGVVRILLDRGADPKKTSKNGFTAYRWAEWYKNDAAKHILKKAGIKK